MIHTACIKTNDRNIIMNIIIDLNNITCMHTTNNNVNTAIITNIKGAVSNSSMHMFDTSSGINDNNI